MSDDNQPVTTKWTAVQVYSLSVLCLILGMGACYLFRGSSASSTPGSTPAVLTQNAPNGATPNGGPAGPAGMTQPSPEQLKQMADKKAAPLLEQLNKQPNDNDTVLKVAGFYFAARQFDESAKYYERSVSLKSTPEVLTRLSNAYFYGGAPDKAISSLNRALQMDPKYANALYNLGVVKWQAEGDPKGAIECWEKLLKTNPNHPNRDQVKKMIALVKQHKEMPAESKQKSM